MPDAHPLPRPVGRYLLYDEIAAGGMAAVHLGRLLGPAGFSRTVAIKRLHPQFAKDPEFVSMFLDEARLAARIRHPNVVSTLDVVAREGELFLVMDYVQGLSLSQLIAAARRAGQAIPIRIVSALLCDTLLGLQAAHEAKNDRGEPLGIVHRDISPQNVLIGADGVARVVDFGVAKAASRAQTTQEGQIKGKLAYMSPEQLQSHPLDHRSDIFAVCTVLWELLAGRRLFAASDPGGTIANILVNAIEPPSTYAPELAPDVDRVVMCGLARAPSERFGSAREMARALQSAAPRAGSLEVEDWLRSIAGELLQSSAERVAMVEEASSSAVDADLLPQSGRPSMRQLVAASAKVADRNSATLTDAAKGTPAPAPASEDTLREVTDLSAARASPPLSAAPWKSTQFRGIALATTLALLAIGTLAIGREDRSGISPVPTANEQGHPADSSSVTTAPAAAQSPAKAQLDAALTPAVSAPAAEMATAAASGAPKATSARTSAASPKARPAFNQTARPSCKPPFTLKPDGSKRFKPECF